jgi:hypothetical protein
MNNQEQNFENYSVELDQILKHTLDGATNSCSIKMKGGNLIEIKYFYSNMVA